MDAGWPPNAGEHEWWITPVARRCYPRNAMSRFGRTIENRSQSARGCAQHLLQKELEAEGFHPEAIVRDW